MAKKNEDLIRERSIEILLNKYKEDNTKLKAEIERLKILKRKFIGYVTILISAVIIGLTSIFSGASIQLILMIFFTFALIGVSIFLMFIYSPKTHHLDITNDTLKRIVSSLNKALAPFSLEDYTFFLPLDETVYQFIPFRSLTALKKYPSVEEFKNNTFKIQDKGILLEPAGIDLIKYIENTYLKEQINMDPVSFENLLQKLLIEELCIITSLNFTRLDKGQYKLILKGSIFNEIYQLKSPDTKTFAQVSCPIYNFVAVLIAQAIRRVIMLKSLKYNSKEDISTGILELGELYP